jgi:hypothetical protein
LLVQWESVQERSVTNRTKVLGVEGSRRFEATFTNGNARPFQKRLFADPAIVGEEQRKKAVGDPAEELESSRLNYLAT